MSPTIIFPQSNPVLGRIEDVLENIGMYSSNANSIYLASSSGLSKRIIWYNGGLCDSDHAQGLARTHKLSDGSIYWFLSYADYQKPGRLMRFRYDGGTDDEHVIQPHPKKVFRMIGKVLFDGKKDPYERHPQDIVFLPDVNNSDSGYLFVALQNNAHTIAIYYWNLNEDKQTDNPTKTGQGFHLLGELPTGFSNPSSNTSFGCGGPAFVIIDKVSAGARDNIGDYYILGAIGDFGNNGVYWYRQYAAKCSDLFPSNQPGQMNIKAFTDITNLASTNNDPVTGDSVFCNIHDGPSQVKLARDSTGKWYLLAYRSDPPDSPNGKDYVDVYPVKFDFLPMPFMRLDPYSSPLSVWIQLIGGDTGFASTGTHYVEKSGRILISSSYRWSKPVGPHGSFVFRVDETPKT